jgi:hypothetical protein
MAWEKKPAIEAGGPACLCCGTPTSMFPMGGLIAVGFGAAYVTCDGRQVYAEPEARWHDDGSRTEPSDEDFWTGAEAEKAAAADPDHDWRIHKHAPLYDAVYQRHAEGQWVLIERGEGFA